MFQLTKVLLGSALIAAASMGQANATCTSYPYTLTNGSTADASQVMANFNCAALTSGATINGATLTGTTAFPGSGSISASGSIGIGMTPSNVLDMTQNGSGAAVAQILNNGTGTLTRAVYQAANGLDTAVFGVLGTNWSSGDSRSANYAIVQGLGVDVVGAAGPIVFMANGTAENGRFGTDGSFLVGTTTNGGWAGNAKVAAYAANGAAVSAYVGGGSSSAFTARVDSLSGVTLFNAFFSTTNVGSITTNGTSTSYNTTSDARLKNTAVAQTNYRDVIEKLWVGDFRWKSDGSSGFGILAQQAYALFPAAIAKPAGPNGVWQADYSKLAPLALWGVKDIYKTMATQNAKDKDREAAIDELRQEMSLQRSQIKNLQKQLTSLTSNGDRKTAMN